MRFLTKETFKTQPTEEVKALMPAEMAKAKELMEQGFIEKSYTAADMTAAWIVWNVESEAKLNEIHDTLPLHPFMNSELVSVLGEGM